MASYCKFRVVDYHIYGILSLLCISWYLKTGKQSLIGYRHRAPRRARGRAAARASGGE